MPLPRMAAGAAIVALFCLMLASPSAAQAPAQQGKTTDTFGHVVMLPERRIVYLKGTATWDAAFETLVDAFKSVYGYLAKEGIKPAGPPLTIYTETDDVGFAYQAAVPITEDPKVAPQGDILLGQAPTGKAFKFVHRGSYEDMDATYEAITNYLDAQHIEAKDIFIEEYQTDPTKTPEEQLVIDILVPAK